MKDALKEHYERKYSYESNSTLIESVPIANIPINRHEAVLKYFPRYFNGGKVFEIGAGNGNVAKTLLSADDKISSYVLCDISLPRIEGLRRNLNDSRVKVLEGNAENLPASEHNSYDAVIMVAVIEHFIDPLRTMQEIRKLLKPGGIVYIDTPNIAKYTQRMMLLLGRFPSTASRNEGLTTYSGKPTDLYDEGHLHYFTYRSLSLMLTERCGFSKVIKLNYPGGWIPLGKQIHGFLSTIRPELFSELAIIAYA